MAQEGTTHPPTEVEFAAKREQLSGLFEKLDAAGKNTSVLELARSIPRIYFEDGEEAFEVFYYKFDGDQEYKRELGIEVLRMYRGSIYGKHGKELDIEEYVEYYPPIQFRFVKEKNNGEYTFFGKPVETIEEIDQALTIVAYMVGRVDSEDMGTRKKPTKGIPDPFVEIVKSIRESSSLQYEYAGRDFGASMSNLENKLKPVEVDDSEYERLGHLTKASTGWVRVQKDGNEFELQCIEIGYSSNGGWEEGTEVRRREVGEENEGVRLFGSSDIDRFSPFSNIRTTEQIRECIDILELLDKAIPEPAKS